MPSRYINRQVILNNSARDRSNVKKRGFNEVEQYVTPVMFHPKDVSLFGIKTVNHTWKRGDHYYKLAHKYYGNPAYWWVIAFFNVTPTENLLSFGDVILIPVNLDVILQAIGI